MVLAQRQRSGSREENGEPTYKSKRLEAHTEGKTASQKERQYPEKNDSIPKRWCWQNSSSACRRANLAPAFSAFVKTSCISQSMGLLFFKLLNSLWVRGIIVNVWSLISSHNHRADLTSLEKGCLWREIVQFFSMHHHKQWFSVRGAALTCLSFLLSPVEI